MWDMLAHSFSAYQGDELKVWPCSFVWAGLILVKGHSSPIPLLQITCNVDLRALTLSHNEMTIIMIIIAGEISGLLGQ